MTASLRARITAAVVLLVVAGCGVLAGVALDRWMLRRHRGAAVEAFLTPFERGGGDRRRGGEERGGARGRERFVDRLARDLALTPEQRTRIDSVFARQGREIRAIMEVSRPRMDSVVGRTRSSIDSILTPQQRARFGELRSRHHSGAERPAR